MAKAIVFGEMNRYMAKDAKHLWALNRKDERFTILAMDSEAEARGFLDS
jgi:hypothetical protein